jgi:hypothetical protein
MICERCGTVFCWDDADEGALAGSRKRYCSKTCASKVSPSFRRMRNQNLSRRRDRAERIAVCAERGKASFESEAAAARGALNPSRQIGCHLYPYECACGKWHLTSEAPLTPERSEMAQALKRALFAEPGQ